MALVPLRYVPISPFIDDSARMQAFLDALGDLLRPDLAQDHAKLCIRRLLEYCGRARPDGVLGAMSARRLAEAVGWRLGRAEDFLDAALASGWLEHGAGGLQIEGWERHGGRAMAQREIWAQQKRDQRARAEGRREQNKQAKRRQRQRAVLDEAASVVGDEEMQNAVYARLTGGVQTADITPPVADGPATVPTRSALKAGLPPAMETLGEPQSCPSRHLRRPKLKPKTEKEKTFLQEMPIDAASLAQISPYHKTSPEALSASALSAAIAHRLGTHIVPSRYQATIGRLAGVSPHSLKAAISQAEQICSHSYSSLNAGLILSCLSRNFQKPREPEFSRIGKIWQRGLEALLVPDESQSL